jgi:two-component system response regulator AtoC
MTGSGSAYDVIRQSAPMRTRKIAAMPGAARVLCVDDEQEILDTLTEFLTLNGYEVVTAQNVGDAFMLLAVAPPDVVLLDIGMPRIDGMSALRRIRDSHPQLPVVMLAANVDLALARDTLKRGAFDYLAKPFDFDHLRQVIEAAVVRRRSP